MKTPQELAAILRRAFYNERPTLNRVWFGRAIEAAFREGFQAGAPDATWDQEWEDGEWKDSISRKGTTRRADPK